MPYIECNRRPPHFPYLDNCKFFIFSTLEGIKEHPLKNLPVQLVGSQASSVIPVQLSVFKPLNLDGSSLTRAVTRRHIHGNSAQII